PVETESGTQQPSLERPLSQSVAHVGRVAAHIHTEVGEEVIDVRRQASREVQRVALVDSFVCKALDRDLERSPPRTHLLRVARTSKTLGVEPSTGLAPHTLALLLKLPEPPKGCKVILEEAKYQAVRYRIGSGHQECVREIAWKSSGVC